MSAHVSFRIQLVDPKTNALPGSLVEALALEMGRAAFARIARGEAAGAPCLVCHAWSPAHGIAVLLEDSAIARHGVWAGACRSCCERHGARLPCVATEAFRTSSPEDLQTVAINPVWGRA